MRRMRRSEHTVSQEKPGRKNFFYGSSDLIRRAKRSVSFSLRYWRQSGAIFDRLSVAGFPAALLFFFSINLAYALPTGPTRVCRGDSARAGGPNFEILADAIYRAEGSAKTSHPYGVLKKFKTTTPRQACINSCKHAWRDWVASSKKIPYLQFLRDRYAPIGAANDPKNLNSHWLKNTTVFYEELSRSA